MLQSSSMVICFVFAENHVLHKAFELFVDAFTAVSFFKDPKKKLYSIFHDTRSVSQSSNVLERVADWDYFLSRVKENDI